MPAARTPARNQAVNRKTPPPAPPPRRRFVPVAAVALALVGLAVSAALLVDSMRPVPAFCSASGCEAVRATAWARPLGIPMPVFGLVFFAAALVLAALPRRVGARQLVALAGGAGAIGLLGLQAFVIGEWCALCVVADMAAIAHAVAIVAAGAVWPSAGRRAIGVTAALAAAAVALPLVGLSSSSKTVAVTAAPAASGEKPGQRGLPEVIDREQIPGRIAVVDFIDFQCPHCRAVHPRLVEALRQVEGPVHVVRKMMPLPQHPGAMPAAIAWCCADAQGKGDEMAEALLAARVEQLTPQGCERIAEQIGLDMDRYRSDAASKATRNRIRADIADAHKAGIKGLPTIYIGSQAFTDARVTVEQFVAALRRAGAS
jgi:protein-disulfide isomerase